MEREPDASATPGRANAFLLQEFARYYLAKKPSQAPGQELETKAELLQSGEFRTPLSGSARLGGGGVVGGNPREAEATSAGKRFPSGTPPQLESSTLVDSCEQTQKESSGSRAILLV